MENDNIARRALNEARSLAANAQYEAALEKYLWFHHHALEHKVALAGVRVSYALGEWYALGEKYPPALHAMRSVRDEAVESIEKGEGSSQLFIDVVSINQLLNEESRSIELFNWMHDAHPTLAPQCYQVIEQVLVDRGEFATCIHYVSEPDEKLEAIRQMHQITMELADENPLLGSPEARLREYAELRLVEQTNRLISIYEGVGQLDKADQVREFVRELRKK